MDNRLTLPQGTMLGESYRIERVIGSGGFGITYAAEDMHLGTRVAIKEYCPAEFGARDEHMRVRARSERHKQTFEWGLRSFLQEARTLARFKHPSIVRVTRVFEAFLTAYMVMEFEEGRDLESWLRRLGRPPTQEELDRIAHAVLDALEMLHGQNFLHRDIAPDNILVRGDGSPVLLDFGAARRAVAEKSRTLTGIVKAGYSPQEQYTADSRLQGPWTDLYAFGATLYRAVTGHAPEDATLRAMDEQMPPASAAAVGTFRPGFLTAIEFCLRLRPDERPQSVASLRRMLLDNEPRLRIGRTVEPAKASSLSSRSATGATPSQTPAGRWAIIGAGILLLIAGVYGGVRYAQWDAARSSSASTTAKPPERPDAASPSRAGAAGGGRKNPTLLPDVELFGDVLQRGSSTEVACRQACEEKAPTCVGFSYQQTRGTCVLLRSVNSRVTSPGYISGELNRN